MKKFFLAIGLFSSFFSCEDKLKGEYLIYSNNFSDWDVSNFENARLFIFQKDTLLGNYDTEELILTIPDLPNHHLLKVTVDVLFHDTWDGNSYDGGDGPDFWYMQADGQEFFRNTFSNSPCASTYCLMQSFPNEMYRQNFPKTGAIQTNLPGLCLRAGINNFTTKYRISRIISHKSKNVKLVFGGELNSYSKDNPRCDESWSISKIEVSGLVLD
jgi:hypothetical protein